MASQSTKTPAPDAAPQDGGQAPAAAAPDPAPAASGPLVMEYLDETPRTYLFPGAGPQTAERGDVCELPLDPGDGRWAPSKRKPTRGPDNDPAEAAKRAARQSAERARIHAAVAHPTEQAADAAGEA